MHQMPAADPEPERLDETQVKTIQTKANYKLDPAMPVRTRMPSRAVPCGPRAQHRHMSGIIADGTSGIVNIVLFRALETVHNHTKGSHIHV